MAQAQHRQGKNGILVIIAWWHIDWLQQHHLVGVAQQHLVVYRFKRYPLRYDADDEEESFPMAPRTL